MTIQEEQSRPQSYLVADIGSARTAVLLFDVVDGAYRLLGRASAATTVYAPWSDLVHGLLAAIRDLSRRTGRPLVSGNTLLMPQKENHAGVDQFLMVVSAAPPLRAILVGLSEDVSLASARRVLHTVYAQEVDTFSLADSRSEADQITAMTEHEPDLIFLTGGTDGGADQRLLPFVDTVRLGVNLLADTRPIPVLFAGNQRLRDQVSALLDGATLFMADNVRPALDSEQTGSAAEILGELYESLKIRELPGLHHVSKWSHLPPIPTARAFATVTQYYASLQQQPVLGLEIGTESVTLVPAEPHRAGLTVRSDLGMGHAITNILDHVTPAQIAAWLPYEASDDEVLDFLHHKSLHPQTIPMTDQELQLEQAVAREMVRHAARGTPVAWQGQQAPAASFRLLLARGHTFVNAPRPGQVLGMILDALQPVGIFAVALDRYGVLPALGALAAQHALAAVQALESGLLSTLGWVVAVNGRGATGQKALEVQIESEHSNRYEGVVNFGALELFPLAAGRARVTLKPTRRFDIGLGAGKGTTISVSGGTVGLVVDARGRPLALPEDAATRRRRQQQWLYDLGG